ncbi:MAG TPA: hypothetical protein P5572_18680 [Phycisphaerae bacterium]|nr:hypothetical protein [Phycisphaerales bacterium]HRX87055.1 hypothetical protein [Phycisphaerae bacterium]
MLAALGVPWLLSGCACSQKVWVERTQTLTIPATDLQSLTVETHNGGVKVSGEADRDEISVTARIRAGGRNRESAHACLDALEIVSEPTADGGHRLTSRWTEPQHPDWGEQVGFKIVAPARLALDVSTHNGGVSVERIDGDCRLVSHNGGIKALKIGGPLFVQTHNGGINAVTSGSSVDLQTQNGGVHLDGRGSSQLGGKVASHNGGIRVDLGKKTATSLECTTKNGGITCSADMTNTHHGERHLSCDLAGGGPHLLVETHNGGIRVKQ